MRSAWDVVCAERQNETKKMNIDDRVSVIFRELERAIDKFPTWPTDPLHALAVLGEEFGELTKDVLQLTYEPHKTSIESMKTEAIQTAAMAIRFVMSIDDYVFSKCSQHKQIQGLV